MNVSAETFESEDTRVTDAVFSVALMMSDRDVGVERSAYRCHKVSST